MVGLARPVPPFDVASIHRGSRWRDGAWRVTLRRVSPVRTALLRATTVALATASVFVAPSSASAAPVRIMPVGDSITQGSAGDYTWRFRLWESLQTGGPAGGVDFVGTRNALWNPQTGKQDGNRFYADPNFDQDHQAIWLRTLIDESLTIGGTIKAMATKPDVIVVDLGTNDYARGASKSMTALRAFITNARAAAPGVDVVVLGLYRLYNVKGRAYENTSYVQGFNASLPTLAAQLDTPSQRVVAAPVEPAFDAATMTWDGRHPTPKGELVLARAASDALQTIGVGSGWDGASIAGWPAKGPTPTLTAASTTSFNLQWAHTTAGALAYRIEYRDVSGNGPWKLVGTPAAGNGSFKIGGFPVGSTVTARVTPVRGEMAGQQGATPQLTLPTALPRSSKPWWQLW